MPVNMVVRELEGIFADVVLGGIVNTHKLDDDLANASAFGDNGG